MLKQISEKKLILPDSEFVPGEIIIIFYWRKKYSIEF